MIRFRQNLISKCTPSEHIKSDFDVKKLTKKN